MKELYIAYKKLPNYFLLLGHQTKAYNYTEKKEDELPDLSGLSGAVVWGIDSNSDKIWIPEKSAKIVSIYLGHSENNCMFSTKWCIIDKIIQEFENDK